MLETLAERERLTSLAYGGGWIALVLIIATCLWIASKLFWQMMPTEPVVDQPAATHSPSQSTAATTRLQDLHLFGQAGSVAAAAIIDAPETTLDLRLLGTLASDDPSSGLAIIIDGDGRESNYGVGDDLPGSARLHEIYADRVLLVRQGQYETLSLRDDQGNVSSRPRRGVTRGATLPQSQTRPMTPGIRGVDWQAVQQQYRMDPAELAKNISFQTHTENGKPIGVRLQAGRDAAVARLMSQAGLRTTDVITSVNGIPLNDPSRTFEAMSQLQNQTRFTVVVQRNGRAQTLNIDLNQ
jgi:general secretion pathway protein C